MILNRLSARRWGTIYLAFLVIFLFILVVTVLIHAFRPHYSPPPTPADPSPDAAEIDTDDEFTLAQAQKIAQHPPPCRPLPPVGLNYINFSCADVKNPKSPAGPWIAKGWTSTGGAGLQKYNRNFGDGNKSRINGVFWPNGVYQLGGAWDIYFFSGGANNAISSLTRQQNLWFFRCRFDRGNCPFHFSAWIGSSTLQGDTGQATLTFLDQNLSPLGKAVTLGPVAAPALGGVPKLILQKKNGIVPVGTRFVQIDLVFIRAGGVNNFYNDGAIDEPQLTLGP